MKKPVETNRWPCKVLSCNDGLERAVRTGDLASATHHIRDGADVDRAFHDGLTPLMWACGLGQPQMVAMLLTAGAAAAAVDRRAGATALHKAALSGNPDIIELLLDGGAFVDQQSPIVGNTALMDAVIYKQERAVAMLLRRRARTNIRNHWNETAMELARRDGLISIERLIAQRDDDVARELSKAPLASAIAGRKEAEVERLIESGADVDVRLPMCGSPDDDYTPLAIAAREGLEQVVRALLRAGADRRRVVGLFLGTALHEACYFGHVEAVRAMIEGTRGAEVAAAELDAQGALNGMSPLHDAVWHGHLEVARLLVDAGARVDLRTHAGMTARDLAERYGYRDIVELLAEAEETCVPKRERR